MPSCDSCRRGSRPPGLELRADRRRHQLDDQSARRRHVGEHAEAGTWGAVGGDQAPPHVEQLLRLGLDIVDPDADVVHAGSVARGPHTAWWSLHQLDVLGARYRVREPQRDGGGALLWGPHRLVDLTRSGPRDAERGSELMHRALEVSHKHTGMEQLLVVDHRSLLIPFMPLVNHSKINYAHSRPADDRRSPTWLMATCASTSWPWPSGCSPSTSRVQRNRLPV